MGNSLGGKKTTKVMKIDGETFNLKTPVKAGDVTKDYPGFVLLESEAVKHYGTRAKPLEADRELLPKRLYFLVQLPKETVVPRRVRSGITMSAKDRLESLMLARRSSSDLAIMKQSSNTNGAELEGSQNGGRRLKLKLPKAEVEKLMRESKDEAEAAEKIMGLCMASSRDNNEHQAEENNADKRIVMGQQVHWKGGREGSGESTKTREKRVSFMPISEERNQMAVMVS
ncbi:hypothetical protein L6164_026755 [Bauhinia variegata]|uniref:Uncharacterized protein n=1 Tax=Bauhinia variegata TaxID=167791 RepID=A0ACB9LSK6_BAUVA|nr:hypothetical protein L6164_026755 [Bauhinia variegata]